MAELTANGYYTRRGKQVIGRGVPRLLAPFKLVTLSNALLTEQTVTDWKLRFWPFRYAKRKVL
jgi:hypothetical protein